MSRFSPIGPLLFLQNHHLWLQFYSYPPSFGIHTIQGGLSRERFGLEIRKDKRSYFSIEKVGQTRHSALTTVTGATPPRKKLGRTRQSALMTVTRAKLNHRKAGSGKRSMQIKKIKNLRRAHPHSHLRPHHTHPPQRRLKHTHRASRARTRVSRSQRSPLSSRSPVPFWMRGCYFELFGR